MWYDIDSVLLLHARWCLHLHIESLRERSAAQLLAQGSAVSLITAFLLIVTAGAVFRNYKKYDTLTLPMPQKAAAVIPDTPDEEAEESAVIQAIRCWNVSDYASAEPLLKQALSDAESETEKTRYPGAAAIDLRLGMLCYENGKYAEAAEYLDAAKKSFLTTLSETEPEVLLTDGQRALCEICTGNETEGWELLQALEPVAKDAKSPADRMDACNLLARGCVLTEQTADAAGWYEQLLKTAEDTKSEQAYLKDYKAYYAGLLLADGQADKAAELCSSVLAERGSGMSDRECTRFSLLLARAKAGATDAEEALKTADEAYRAETHTVREDAEYALAVMLAKQAAGDTAGALEQAKTAVSAAAGTDLEAACREQLGLAYEDAGKPDDAIEAYNAALALSRQKKDDAQTAACLADLCRVCRLQGDYNRSVDTGLEADKLLTEQYGKYSVRRVPLLSELALSYGERHQLGLAVRKANVIKQIVHKQDFKRKASVLSDLTFGRVRTLENSGRNSMSYLQLAADQLDSQYGKTDAKAIMAQIWLGDAGMRCRAYEEASAAYGEAAARLSQAGAEEETVSAVLGVQTAVGGIRGFLAERLEEIKAALAKWDGT